MTFKNCEQKQTKSGGGQILLLLLFNSKQLLLQHLLNVNLWVNYKLVPWQAPIQKYHSQWKSREIRFKYVIHLTIILFWCISFYSLSPWYHHTQRWPTWPSRLHRTQIRTVRPSKWVGTSSFHVMLMPPHRTRSTTPGTKTVHLSSTQIAWSCYAVIQTWHPAPAVWRLWTWSLETWLPTVVWRTSQGAGCQSSVWMSTSLRTAVRFSFSFYVTSISG